MFSISGHILNNKRLITGINLYENLVFFKYNEKLLKCEGEQYCDCKRKNNFNSWVNNLKTYFKYITFVIVFF